MSITTNIPNFDVSTIMNEYEIYGELTTKNWNIYQLLLERDDYEEKCESLYDEELSIDFYIIINSQMASNLLQYGYIMGEYQWMENYTNYIRNMQKYNHIGIRIAKQILEYIAYGKIGNSLLQFVHSYKIDNEPEEIQIQMIITECMLKIYENLYIEGLSFIFIE